MKAVPAPGPDKVMIDISDNHERLMKYGERLASLTRELRALRDRKTRIAKQFTDAIKEREDAIEEVARVVTEKKVAEDAQLPMFDEVPVFDEEETDDDADEGQQPLKTVRKPRKAPGRNGIAAVPSVPSE